MRLARSLLQPHTKLEPSREAWGWSKTNSAQTCCQTGLVPTPPHFWPSIHWTEHGFGASSLLCDSTSQPGDRPGAQQDNPASRSIPTEHLLSAMPWVHPGQGRPQTFLPTMLHPTGAKHREQTELHHHPSRVCRTQGCKRLQGQVC